MQESGTSIKVKELCEIEENAIFSICHFAGFVSQQFCSVLDTQIQLSLLLNKFRNFSTTPVLCLFYQNYLYEDL